MAADIKDFIVTIDLGSSKVTAVAGQKQPDGVIKVLAYYQESSDTFIRKGRINNVNKMTQCAKNIKEALEKRCKKAVTKAYVGVGGMGMHTLSNSVKRSFSEKHVISQDIVDSLFDENRQKNLGERNILEVIPQEYKIGTQITTEPVGAFTDSIEASFRNIVANMQAFDQVRKCFNAAGISVVETPVAILRVADIMLTEPEKRSGCVFVDMGAETTSVAIFKNNLLRHFAAIPLGGANITRDIMSLQLEEDEAEALKKKFGRANNQDSNAAPAPIVTSDGRKFEYDEFANIIEARVEEIVMNIKHQVELSGYDKGVLNAGIVLTGGASNLKGIDSVITRMLSIEKLHIMKSGRVMVRGERTDAMSTETYSVALALFDEADQNCCGGELGEEQPIDLFTEPTVEPTTDTTEQELTTQPATQETAPAESEDAGATKDDDENPDATGEDKPAKSGGFMKTLKAWGRKLGEMVGEE